MKIIKSKAKVILTREEFEEWKESLTENWWELDGEIPDTDEKWLKFLEEDCDSFADEVGEELSYNPIYHIIIK